MTAIQKKKSLISEKNAMRFSFTGSALILVIELISWAFTHSNTILMDCIFDSMDLILIGPFLVLIPMLYKPESERHPYGYGPYESLFIIFKYSALVIVCATQLVDNVKLIRAGGQMVEVSDVVSFELFTLVICLVIYLVLHHMNRKTNSEIIHTELYAWRFDVISCLSIAAVFLTEIPLEHTKLSWICPYMDPLVAILMAVVLLAEPCQEIYRNVRKLLLFSVPEDQVNKVREIAEEEMERFGCQVTFLEAVQTGRKTWIGVYFKSSADVVRMHCLNEAAQAIEEQLGDMFDEFDVDIIPDTMYNAAAVSRAV